MADGYILNTSESPTCGMLDHGEKECSEKKQVEDNGGRGSAQYGPWLRGKPGRRFGRGGGSSNKYREERNERELRILPKKSIELDRKIRVGGKLVIGTGWPRENSPISSDEVLEALGEGLKGKHENGKVKNQTEKQEGTIDKHSMVTLDETMRWEEMDVGMQWEIAMHEGREDLKKEKNITTKETSEGAFNLDWAKENMSPLTMCFDQKKG